MILNNQKKIVLKSCLVFSCMVIAAHFLTPWYTYKNALQIVFGGTAVFFLPGFLLTKILSARHNAKIKSNRLNKESELDLLEGVTLSLLYSIALVTIILIIINRLQIALTSSIVFAAIAGINIIIGAGTLFGYWRRRNACYAKKF